MGCGSQPRALLSSAEGAVIAVVVEKAAAPHCELEGPVEAALLKGRARAALTSSSSRLGIGFVPRAVGCLRSSTAERWADRGEIVKRSRRWLIGLATAALALAVVVSILGCGTSKDPFVGRWQEPKDTAPNPIVISKSGDQYVVTIALPSVNAPLPATRQDDKLVGTFGDEKLRFEVVYLPQSGHLTWANSRTPQGPLNKPTEMTKVSDSTDLPTPHSF